MSQTKTFLLPDLGEGLPDATIVEWFVKPGDVIRLDAPLVSMETAKAVVEAVDAKALVFRGRTYDAKTHAPILVFPNPLNPARYVVLNSGIDFRTEGYGNNAHQTPKLPDWAIVDLRTPPGPRWPGKVVDAGFFDESWK